ncbi:helix-turn-helix domain-containing protein [Streptomyces sp. NPDC001514]
MKAATECEQLASSLRELRERSGLSLAALAARTPYSKSSWERYLNGKQPTPRRAVEALCAVTGEPPGRLLALWELADGAWSCRAAPAPRPAPDAPAEDQAVRQRQRPPQSQWQRPPHRHRHRFLGLPVLLAAFAACTVLAALAVLAVVPALRTDGPPRTAEEPSIRNPGCSGPACEGKDPKAMGCGGAGMVTTLADRTAPGGRRLELRYAELCGAVWLRATGLAAGDVAELSLPGGRTHKATAGSGGGGGGGIAAGQYLVTPMAAADGEAAGARACLYPAKGSPPECVAADGS